MSVKDSAGNVDAVAPRMGMRLESGHHFRCGGSLSSDAGDQKRPASLVSLQDPGEFIRRTGQDSACKQEDTQFNQLCVQFSSNMEFI